VIAGILFGLAPRFLLERIDLVASLKAGVRSVTSARNRISATHSLIVAQHRHLLFCWWVRIFYRAVCLNLEKQPLGFDQSRVLLAGINTRMANYRPENVGELYRNLYARLSALPGVRAATLAHYSPMSGSSSTSNISIQDHFDIQAKTCRSKIFSSGRPTWRLWE